MVDREARNQTAVLLRHLAIGRITAKQFDAALESMTFSGQDHIFEAIFEETFSIKSTTHHEVARWILFLQSENEYIWPGIDELPNPLCIIAAVLVAFVLANIFHSPAIGLGIAIAGYGVITNVAAQCNPKSCKPGDLKVWPFHKQDNFEGAKRCPRLLNGNRTMPFMAWFLTA